MVENYMYIDEIIKAYNDCEYLTKLEYPSRSRFKESHIFDEDKSVKWNREQVIIENEKIENALKAYRADVTRLENKIYEDCVNYVVGYYSLSKSKAEHLVSYAHSNYHSCMTDFLYKVEELATLFKDIMALD